MYKLKTKLASTKPTLKFASNSNCAKPLLAVVFFFRLYLFVNYFYCVSYQSMLFAD